MTHSEKSKILIASYLEPELIERIRNDFSQVEVLYEPTLLGRPKYLADHTSLPTRTDDEEKEWKSLLAKADIMFDFDYTHKKDLPELAPKLKWIQATSAGIGQFVHEFGYDRRTSWIFTTASGVHARPLAEFVIMSMLMFSKDTFYLQSEKESHHWQRYCGMELRDRCIAIVGLGKIGREIARLAKAFEMHVIGNRRSEGKDAIPNVDKIYGSNELSQMLEQADFLCLSCPLTPETEGLIGPNELEKLPPHSVLINVSRGAVVDQNALTGALESGRLRGAALDVFRTEPLPDEDRLWNLPNVIICPHSASTVQQENDNLVKLFSENLKRYLANQPLLNKLDTDKLY